jgi:hypothetical protein
MKSIDIAAPQDAAVAEILRRLNAVGASAFPHRSGIRVRPRALVSDDLMADVKAATPALLAWFESRREPKPAWSAESKKLSRTRCALRRQLGRPADPIEKQLINRIAWLRFHVAQFDQAALRSGGLSVGSTAAQLKVYASLISQLRRGEDDFDARCKPLPTDPATAHADLLASISRATRQEADPDDDGDEDGDL